MAADGEATPEPSAAAARRIELLRQGTEAYNRGDLGWVYEHSAEDIQVHTAAGLVNTGDFRGKERFWTWMEQWQEAWSEMTIEIHSVEVFDDRFLLVEVTQNGTGSISGIKTTMELVQLLEVTDEEIARFHLYPDRAAALEALDGIKSGE